jgi:hypothetical protein
VKHILAAALATTFSVSLMASYGVGVSTYPMGTDGRMVSAEATGIVSNNGGVGMQARYTQRMTGELTLDAGAGISGGERSSRFFAGADYELLPDWHNQPRVSVKGIFTSASEFNTRNNILTAAPTVSKGFNMWGQEVYPFAALPYGIGLNSDSKTYETTLNLSVGAISKLPIQGYEYLTANVEATIDIKDSWTGLFLGVSYPLN